VSTPWTGGSKKLLQRKLGCKIANYGNLIDHIAGFTWPFVPLSARFVRSHNLITKTQTKTVNVSQGTSNRRSDFQLTKSKLRLSVKIRVAQLFADIRIICRY